MAVLSLSVGLARPVAGELRLGKTLTTPARLVTGVEAGVTKAGAQFSPARLFLHGTTVAINAILERTGARCALLTTQGFRDIYEIGRVNRPESYNLFFRRHQPLIERDLRYEIRERMDAQGKVLIALDEEQVRAAVADAVRQGVQAVAILFLHSYRNPAHEQRAKEIVEETHPDLFVTASHELSQEYREFERTSTVAANAIRVTRKLMKQQALAKYRINPGNVGGKRRDENFRSIIEVALAHDKPVRIGVNWGSLDQQLLTAIMDANARRAAPRDMRLSSSIAPRLFSGSLRLPHLGDCTHDGQPSRQGHSEMRRSASSTRCSKRS